MISKLAIISFILSIISLIIPSVILKLLMASSFILLLYPIIVLTAFILSTISINFIDFKKVGGKWIAISSFIISLISSIILIYLALNFISSAFDF